MKVFISWSGETSKNIAEIIHQWLPSVIQSVKPYYSPDDITKGTRWGTEIAKELDESKVGIICLTKDNLNSSWIMFEAGALSKNIDKSKVCPILFGIDPADIEGPLVQFQAAKFNKEEIKRVVRMINIELGDLSLSPEVFENVFEMWWPKLLEKIDAEIKKAKSPKSTEKELRGERDILEEILSLTRRISITRGEVLDGEERVSPMAIKDIIRVFDNILNDIALGEDNFMLDHLRGLNQPLRHILRKAGPTGKLGFELSEKLDYIFSALGNIKTYKDQKVNRSKKLIDVSDADIAE